MLYDYHCSACDSTWEEVHRMDDRKIPEGLPCPSCKAEGMVLQSICVTAPAMSYSLETTRSFNKLKGSAFQEKLSRIHAATPGSQLDKQSTIVKIEKP